MAVKIRQMCPEDTEAVFHMEEELFSDAWSLKSLSDSFTFSAYHNMVAEEDGRVLGYLLFMQAVDEGELLRIGVERSCQKRGIGSLLMDAMRDYAISESISQIFLEVRETNTPAKALYEKKGFEVIGVRKKYYRDPLEDAVLMSLSLPVLYP